MRKCNFSFLILVLLLPGWLFAQSQVRLGGAVFVPDQNVGKTRGGLPVLQSRATGGMRNVLVQLSGIPSGEEVQALKAQGLDLQDYLGGNAYFALLSEAASQRAQITTRGVRLTSIMDLRPEWKMASQLARGDIPSWAQGAAGAAKVELFYSPNATPTQVKADLAALGMTGISVDADFHMVQGEAPAEAMRAVAALPYVRTLGYVAPPSELFNWRSSIISRSTYLRMPPALNGRGLSGKGVRVGIWDATIDNHPDFGKRIHQQEAERQNEHGTHVAGTVAGAGLLDPRGKGMAPAAEMWSWNFGVSSNGMREPNEMKRAYEKFGISLTQNSYGFPLSQLCEYYNEISYLPKDILMDDLAVLYPDMLHVFAAGNEGSGCKLQTKVQYGESGFGTAGGRCKNVLYVGSCDIAGTLRPSSSRGPQDDGRIFPTVVARGVDVYSTIPEAKYGSLSGTSMACPVVTGAVALLTERYRQLHSNATPRADLLKAVVANTADDVGNKHPDYSFGFGIMNAEKAAVVLEKGYHKRFELSQGAEKILEIPVPKGCRQIRVMLYWNDPVAVKQYTWGESPLVNNLDLRVGVGSTDYAPWVLDPSFGKVDALAERKQDDLNNIEQVTLDATELGSVDRVVAKIRGKRVAKGAQECVVTWWYEMPDALRIYSPNGGELYEPGLQIPFTVGGFAFMRKEASYTVELSYDGGKKYEPVGEYKVKNFAELYPGKLFIPKDAPLTENALMRARFDNGDYAVSEHPFTIAPVPANLKVETSNCGGSGYKLTWDKVDIAQYGYEIYVVDAENGEVSSLHQTSKADQNTYTVMADQVAGKRNIYFSVAVRTEHGVGERCKAVFCGVSSPMILAEDQVAFREDFTHVPSRFFTTKAGEKLEVVYRENSPAFKTMSHSLILRLKEDNKSLNTTDYFAPENAPSMATLDFCSVDLSALAPTEKAYLHISGILVSKPENTRVRLLDGDGTPLADQTGATEIMVGQNRAMNRHGAYDYYYELAGGKNHHLSLQYVGKKAFDAFLIELVELMRIGDKKTLVVGHVRVGSPKENMGVEPVSVGLLNPTASALEGIEVKLFVNDNLQKIERVERLDALQSMELKTTLDFSTKDPMGARMHVRAVASVPKDTDIRRAEGRKLVLNLGRVVRMGTSEMKFVPPVGLVNNDPQKVYKLDEPIIFTDDGGAVGNYSRGQKSSMRIEPKDPSQRVQVTFHKVELREHAAELRVFTGKVNLADVAKLKPNYTLRVSTLDPITFTSGADDGALTFLFKSDGDASLAGWEAEVRAVPVQNTLTFLGVSSTAVAPGSEGDVPVTVKFRNNWESPLPLVAIDVMENGKFKFQEALQNVAKGEAEITLKNSPKGVKRGDVTRWDFKLFSPTDYDNADNTGRGYVVFDNYCVPAAPRGGSKNRPYVYSVSVGSEHRSFDPLKDTPYVLHAQPMVLYKEQGAFEGTLKCSYGSGKWKPQEFVYIDWDNDGQFSDAEAQELAPTKDWGGYWNGKFTVDCANHLAGTYRMRMITASSKYTVTPCVETPIFGSVYDVELEIKEGNPPVDLSIGDLKGLKSGLKLATPQKLILDIINNTSTPYKGAVTITVTLNGVELTAVTHDFSTKPLKKGKYNRQEVEFGMLSFKRGANTVKVTISTTEEDSDKTNNSKSLTIHNIQPEQKLFALAFNGTKERKVEIKGVPANSTGYSIETWVLSAAQQSTPILSAGNVTLRTTFMQQGDIPDNALVLEMGSVIGFTPKNSLMPGLWNHIAVVFSDIQAGSFFGSGKSKATVYINGKAVTLDLDKDLGAPSTSLDFKIGAGFKGLVKDLRVWTKVLTETDIKENMTKMLDKSTANLSAEFVMNEGYGSPLIFSTNGKYEGHIEATPEAIADTENRGAWMIDELLIANVQLKGETVVNGVPQIEVAPAAKRTYTITFDQGVDKTKITGTITPVWASGVKIEYASKAVTPATEFDFSSEVKLHATAELFGVSLVDDMTLCYRESLSNACELSSLKIEKAKNKGLKDDQVLSVQENMRLDLKPSTTGTIDQPEQVVLTFEISGKAKLEVVNEDGQHVQIQSGATPVDLTKLLSLHVVAENGQVKTYHLEIENEQLVTLKIDKDSYTYGDEPEKVYATAASGREITFVSTDPTVATVADGKIHIGQPGTTTITALQKGGFAWSAGKSHGVTITVEKLPTTATPAIANVPYVSDIPWAFKYSKLVSPADGVAMPIEELAKCYTIKAGDGTEYKAEQTLPIGEYTLAVANSKTIETDCYKITPAEGKLRVVQGGVYNLDFVVLGENDAPVKNATVIISNIVQHTDTDGKARILAKPSDYEAHVEATGYQSVDRMLHLEDKDITTTVKLQKPVYTLTYKVEGEGTVNGAKEIQVPVAHYGEGIDVIAAPKPGYVFVEWSDKKTDALRRDVFVAGNAIYTAKFDKPIFAVTYIATEGGTLRGKTEQQIRAGEEGEEVTAEPIAGYYFEKWSDASVEATRKETAVSENKTLKAIFRPFATIPVWNDFHDGSLGKGWYTVSGNKNAATWVVTNKSPQAFPVFPKNPTSLAALVQNHGKFDPSNTYLYTARYGLDRENDLVISFAYYNRGMGNPKLHLELEYTLDGKTWTSLEALPVVDDIIAKEFTIQKDVLKGKPFVQFRWWWHGVAPVVAFVDDVSVHYAGLTEELTISYEAVPAGAASFTIGGKTNQTSQKVAYGAKPLPVTVVPTGDYTLGNWSTGSKELVYQGQNAYGDEKLIAYLAKPDMIKLDYKALPAEGGHFERDGKAITVDYVDKGKKTAAVTAVPSKGYSFVRWNDNGSTVAARDGVMAYESGAIIGVFEKQMTTLSVTVTAEGMPSRKIANAQITLGDSYFANTDKQGVASLTVRPGSYTLSISAGNEFEVFSCPIEVKGESQSESFALRALQSVVFMITANGQPVSGASSSLDGYTKQSDDKGQLSYNLATGSYEYEIRKEGYVPARGTVTLLAGKMSTKAVELKEGFSFAYTQKGQGKVEAKLEDGTAVNSGDILAKGQAVRLTLVAEKGHELKSVKVNGTERLAQVAKDNTLLVLVDRAVKVEIVFENISKKPEPTPSAVAETQLLRIAPNPVLSQARILGVSQDTRATIVNLQGVVVRTVQISAAGNVDLSSLPSGVYVLRIGRQNLRFVKH